jgi:hypothetical protein
LAGLPVAAGKAFIIAATSEADAQTCSQHLGIRDGVDPFCRPFAASPSMD